jgi:hypothetical protein
LRPVPTGAEKVRSWGQTGSDRLMLKTALLTDRRDKGSTSASRSKPIRSPRRPKCLVWLSPRAAS